MPNTDMGHLLGRKSVLKSYKMFDASSMASTQTSGATSCINLDKASVHVTWAGTSPVGLLTVQARNGELDAWYTLDFGSAMAVSGNTGECQIIFNEMPFTDIRLVYARTSGTGSLTATISAKVTGA